MTSDEILQKLISGENIDDTLMINRNWDTGEVVIMSYGGNMLATAPTLDEAIAEVWEKNKHLYEDRQS